MYRRGRLREAGSFEDGGQPVDDGREREEGGGREKSRTDSIEPFRALGYDPPRLLLALSLRLRDQACLDLPNLSSSASEGGCLVEDEEKEAWKEG